MAEPDRQGARRAPAPAGVEKGTGPDPVEVRRGFGGRGLAGRSDRGRPGRVRAQHEPLAPPSRGSRAAALARQPKAPRGPAGGTARAKRNSCSWPRPRRRPARRGTLRALARELVARGIASRIRYETVRRVLKKNELTPWWRVQRGYPPVSPEADFVTPRETGLNHYRRPYDARYPVIGRDEQPQPLRADQWPSQRTAWPSACSWCLRPGTAAGSTGPNRS